MDSYKLNSGHKTDDTPQNKTYIGTDVLYGQEIVFTSQRGKKKPKLFFY